MYNIKYNINFTVLWYPCTHSWKISSISDNFCGQLEIFLRCVNVPRQPHLQIYADVAAVIGRQEVMHD